jgi:hypothetical protein
VAVARPEAPADGGARRDREVSQAEGEVPDRDRGVAPQPATAPRGVGDRAGVPAPFEAGERHVHGGRLGAARPAEPLIPEVPGQPRAARAHQRVWGHVQVHDPHHPRVRELTVVVGGQLERLAGTDRDAGPGRDPAHVDRPRLVQHRQHVVVGVARQPEQRGLDAISGRSPQRGWEIVSSFVPPCACPPAAISRPALASLKRSVLAYVERAGRRRGRRRWGRASMPRGSP